MGSRNTRLEIQLSCITQNVYAIKQSLGGTAVMAVVKADGYGHGLVPSAQAALAGGACALAVAIAEEGVALRNAGITADILVMGATSAEGVDLATQYGLLQTIYQSEVLSWMDTAAQKHGCKVRAHLKIETGMRRIGLSYAQLQALLQPLQEHQEIVVEGIFSHFSETNDPLFTKSQLASFHLAVSLAEAKFGRLLRHMASSGAALSSSANYLDMVRCGIAIYGYPPCKTLLPLQMAMSIYSSITQLSIVPKGESIGYGRSFYTLEDSLIATIPIGYGDGYPRCLGGRGYALVHGNKAPIVGRVCMDQCMLDVTNMQDVKVHDEVVLMGRQGDESITAQDLATLCDTISYEILLRPTQRMNRIYR